MSTVGFIGLGAMGAAISRSALTDGVHVVAFDIDPAPVAELAEAGATPARSVGDVARAADWIVTSLPSAAAVLTVVREIAESGATVGGVIETSTLSVTDKELAAAVLADAGIAMADCPLSGTSSQAREGDLVAYVSGEPDLRRAVTPVVASFTRAQHDLGALGNGTRMKLVANLLVAVHNVATAEALLLAARSGLDLGVVLRAVGDGAGSSRMLEIRGPLMAAGDYDARMRVDHFVKDVDIIEAQAATTGAPVPLLAASAGLYRRMLAQGMGDLDTAAVYEELAGPRSEQTQQP